MRAAHYRGPRDGDIRRYLKETHEAGGGCLPSFQRYIPFQQLWALGVVLPEVANIRLVFGQGFDEHYLVVSETEVDGVSLPAHSGRPGRHNIRTLLTKTAASFWEAGGLDPRAFRLV